MTRMRLFLLPNELRRFGGAAEAGRLSGADEIWTRAPVGIASECLWRAPWVERSFNNVVNFGDINKELPSG